MTAPALLLDGRYELLERLGRGGEAEVHRARDARSGAEVAIRLPLSGRSPAARPAATPPAEFHPGWVRRLDAGRDPQRGPYEVFELLAGETFRQKRERQPLTPAAWRAFAQESLAAVGALHAAGWTHGDLNAENFLQLATPPHAWKLLELPFFHLPGASALFGSIHTLAPEQLEGRAAGPASDVYALGCLYYYGAAGVYPHAGSEANIAIGRLRFAPDPLEARAPDFPAPLSRWVMTLLERQPQNRPAALTAARHLLAIA